MRAAPATASCAVPAAGSAAWAACSARGGGGDGRWRPSLPPRAVEPFAGASSSVWCPQAYLLLWLQGLTRGFAGLSAAATGTAATAAAPPPPRGGAWRSAMAALAAAPRERREVRAATDTRRLVGGSEPSPAARMELRHRRRTRLRFSGCSAECAAQRLAAALRALRAAVMMWRGGERHS